MPLRNKPYVQYMADTMRAAQLEGAVFSMGYRPEPILRYFMGRDLDGFSLDYAAEECPLGTAGGIKNVEEYLDEGPFLATNGDILTGLNLAEVIEAHADLGALATITLTLVDGSTAYGLVEVDHRLRVKKFVEKSGNDEVLQRMGPGRYNTFRGLTLNQEAIRDGSLRIQVRRVRGALRPHALDERGRRAREVPGVRLRGVAAFDLQLRRRDARRLRALYQPYDGRPHDGRRRRLLWRRLRLRIGWKLGCPIGFRISPSKA